MHYIAKIRALSGRFSTNARISGRARFYPGILLESFLFEHQFVQLRDSAQYIQGVPGTPCIYRAVTHRSFFLNFMADMYVENTFPGHCHFWSILDHFGPFAVLPQMESCFEDLRSKTFQWEKKKEDF